MPVDMFRSDPWCALLAFTLTVALSGAFAAAVLIVAALLVD